MRVWLGPLAVRELSLSEALFWFRKTTSELSFWGGVGNAAHGQVLDSYHFTKKSSLQGTDQ